MASLTWGRVLTAALLTVVVVFIAIMAINMTVIPPLLVFAVLFAVLAGALPRWGAIGAGCIS